MSNLLDKASIILTPTAYNNGEALCVKPSDGSGDFDFSRNSAATRVNAQGLVENVQILSSNLVQNGDFSEEGSEEVSNGSFSQEGVQLVTNGDFSSDTAWVKGTGTTISGGSANFVNADGVSLYQSIGTQSGFVKITFNVTDYTSGTLNVYSGGNQSVGSINVSANALGTYTAYVDRNGGNVNIIFGSSDNFTGSIDNVSVREVGQDWTLGTGWSIGEDKAVFDGGADANIIQSISITTGNTFKITLDVSEMGNGELSVRLGGGAATEIGRITENGSYVFYGVSISPNITFRALSSFNGSITNISVKEVGQNWTLGSNIAIGENKLIGTNANSSTYQNVGIQANKKYKIQFTILDYSNGNVRFIINGSPNVVSSDVSSNGEHTLYINSNSNSNGYLSIQVFNNFNGSVTNISAVQISSDTNLPRINYEGFSYQDAFGSELLTDGAIINSGGGSFTFTPNGLIAISDGTSGTVARPILLWTTLTIGKQYRIVGTPTINSGNTNYSLYDGVAYVKNLVAVQAFDITFTCQGSSVFFTNDGTQTFDIDWDLSIKEVTGQEVVPDSGCGSWLFEPQSTNVITQSETFSNASWVNNGVTITSNEITSPSGTLNADLLTGVSGGFGVVKFSTWTATNKVASCFAKKGSTNLFKIANVSGGIGGVTFNLENGTITNEDSGFDGEIENYGNGWYRCTAIDTLGRTGTFSLGVTAASESVYIWGAMLEQNSFSTSYIPTSGSAVTRNQDVCTNGGSSASINNTEGTLYFEGAALANDGTFRQISLTQTAGGGDVITLDYSSSSNGIRSYLRVGAVSQSLTYILSDETQYNKIAVRYKDTHSIWVNGLEVASQALTTLPINLNVLTFDNGSGGGNLYGKTKAVAVWKEALSDAELTELTTI